MSSAKILLSAFEEFDGHELNSSLEILKVVTKGHSDLDSIVLPVSFNGAWQKLQDKIESGNYQAVIALGQADPREQITIERVAINFCDARIPDNLGAQPKDMTIIEEAAPAYFSTLPLKEMIAAGQATGVPCEISNTAGTYVCNELMYRLLHHCGPKGIKAGFIHCPLLPEQTKTQGGGLGLSTQKLGIESFLQVIL